MTVKIVQLLMVSYGRFGSEGCPRFGAGRATAPATGRVTDLE